MKITNGFNSLKVQFLDSGNPEPFKMFWNWYRETWYSLRNEEYDYTNPKHIKAVKEVIENKAIPTPQEALNFQIRVENLSRVALAQFTRGRVGWGYVVTSQMPEAIQHNVIVPKNIYESEFTEEVSDLIRKSQELYDKMIEKKIPPQDCRYITIHGQTTNLTCIVNFMALKGYFARRCENGLTDELNLIGRLIKYELQQIHINNDGTDKIPGSGWSFLLQKLDAMGSNNVCLNYDFVFGNTGRSKSLNNSIPSLINEENKCDWDFSKSAWYQELLMLPEHLLFSGEKEMIDDWKKYGFVDRLKKLSV